MYIVKYVKRREETICVQYMFQIFLVIVTRVAVIVAVAHFLFLPKYTDILYESPL
jgi:hypothetical protein